MRLISALLIVASAFAGCSQSSNSGDEPAPPAIEEPPASAEPWTSEWSDESTATYARVAGDYGVVDGKWLEIEFDDTIPGRKLLFEIRGEDIVGAIDLAFKQDGAEVERAPLSASPTVIAVAATEPANYDYEATSAAAGRAVVHVRYAVSVENTR